MKKKLYIGCALTKIPHKEEKGFLKMLAVLKIGLKDHFEILEFKGVTGPAIDATPTEVYIHDINDCVKRADYMLAICDHPSLGLGYEIATAVEKQDIPVLAVAHKNALVTKLIVGITHKRFKFIRYSSVEEILKEALALTK